MRILLGLLVAVVAGCATPVSFAEPEPIPASTYPTMPPGVIGPFPVTKASDGDTIWIDHDGRREKLRLIGIDTPELNDPRGGVQCFATEAADHARTQLGGRSVFLEPDPSQAAVDRFGRTLAYVWTESGRLFNLDIINDGFAHEYTYNAPYRYQQLFRDAESSARNAGRGLWSPAACA